MSPFLFAFAALCLLGTRSTALLSSPGAEPNNLRAYYAALLASAEPQEGPTAEEAAAHKKRRDLAPPAAKKYDRNCFFSPVQCMLSFKENAAQRLDANDAVLLNTLAGRR